MLLFSFQLCVHYQPYFLFQFQVHHKNWNRTVAPPICGFQKLDVRFKPKFDCPSVQTFEEHDHKFQVRCRIISNPPVTEDRILLTLGNNSDDFFSKNGNVEVST